MSVIKIFNPDTGKHEFLQLTGQDVSNLLADMTALEQRLSILEEQPSGDTTPSGLIAMWNGTLTELPEGWALCDGTNGTPDLQDKFVVGSGNEYNIGDTGGAKEVTLSTAQMPSHTHGRGTLTTSTAGEHTHVYEAHNFNMVIMEGTGDYDGAYYRETEHTTRPAGNHSHTISGSTASAGSGQAHENRPPYYALAYIMKL